MITLHDLSISFKFRERLKSIPGTGLISLTLSIIILLTACSQPVAEGLTVGDSAPGFTLQSTDGNPVSLTDYIGKQPVLLYFHMAVG